MDLLGVPICLATANQALRAVERACDMGEDPVSIAFVNTHGMNLAHDDPAYHAVLRSFDFRFNDGVGITIAALIKGKRIPENLNGNDLTPLLLRVAAARGWPVFLLGAAPGVAERAAGTLAERVPGLAIAGTRHGYFEPSKSPEIADAIRASGAKLLLVCLGNPRQEQWIASYLDRTGACVGAGVGAFLDILVGDIPRAPHWMTAWGLEWAHRLRCEPARLWRRYLIGNPLFLWRVVLAEFRGSSARTIRP